MQVYPEVLGFLLECFVPTLERGFSQNARDVSYATEYVTAVAPGPCDFYRLLWRACICVGTGTYSCEQTQQGLSQNKAGLLHNNPEGPSTQYLRSLVPKTIYPLTLRTRVLKYWVLGPSGQPRERNIYKQNPSS